MTTNTPIPWAAILTLLSLALFCWTIALVALARGRYGVRAPATTGDPMFERTYRVQMNTLENLVLFLPALWLAQQWAPGFIVPAAGFTWLAGRVLYAVTYRRDPKTRSAGYSIALAGFFTLAFDAAVGIARALLA